MSPMTNNQEMPPNADTAKLRRRGDVREDGFVFVRYHPNYKNGEYWISPNRHAQAKPVPPTRIRNRNQDTGTMNLTNSPHLRIRDYRPRYRLQKRKLTQKEFDNLPYGPNTEPAMTATENMRPHRRTAPPCDPRHPSEGASMVRADHQRRRCSQTGARQETAARGLRQLRNNFLT